jgi:hypothetical protein
MLLFIKELGRGQKFAIVFNAQCQNKEPANLICQLLSIYHSFSNLVLLPHCSIIDTNIVN